MTSQVIASISPNDKFRSETESSPRRDNQETKMIAYIRSGRSGANGKDRAFTLYDTLFEGTDQNQICVRKHDFATIPVNS